MVVLIGCIEGIRYVMSNFEIWSINNNGSVVCHLVGIRLNDIDGKLLMLNDKYPGRIFLISTSITARRVIDGEVTGDGCYN